MSGPAWPERKVRALDTPAFDPLTVARYMGAANPVCQHFDIRVVDVVEGAAQMVMTTRPDMGNTYGVVHGGIVLSFADMCFGMAANSRDVQAVTASAQIHYLAPVPIGIELHGSAREAWLGARSAIYDVEISDGDGTTLSLMQARARLLYARVIPADWTGNDEP